MLEHYYTTLFRLGQPRDLAYSALPDAPVQPHPEGRKADRDRRSQEPASPGRHRRGSGTCRSSGRRRDERVLGKETA